MSAEPLHTRDLAESLEVPIARPLMGEEEAEAVLEPLRRGWVVQGPKVAEFEERFAAAIGAGHGVATTSCTTALHLAVRILGAGPGDEVLVPAFTWVSTANVVEYVGARPVFVDVELESFNTTAQRLEAAITERTVGMLPVHLFGRCLDWDPIADVARRHGLWTVEDAACAFGASTGGRAAGTLGDLGCFSFHPRKSITTGEGGMLTTASAEHDRLARVLRDHGADRSDLERHEGRSAFLLADYGEIGFNYRMTDVQAAIGCAQLDRAPDILAERRRQAARYQEALGHLEWLDLPQIPDGDDHGWQAYVALFRPHEPALDRLAELGGHRDRVMLALEEQRIATRQGTHAAALTRVYRERYGIDEGDVPNSALAERLSLSLPLYAGMTEAQQEKVVEALPAAFEATR